MDTSSMSFEDAESGSIPECHYTRDINLDSHHRWGPVCLWTQPHSSRTWAMFTRAVIVVIPPPPPNSQHGCFPLWQCGAVVVRNASMTTFLAVHLHTPAAPPPPGIGRCRLLQCLWTVFKKLKWNATVTMNRAPMINQNITFHLPKYNSNMFCVLKVITDRLTLLCLTMYSAIFLQSLLWDLNQMTSQVHTRFPGGLHHKHHRMW